MPQVPMLPCYCEGLVSLLFVRLSDASLRTNPRSCMLSCSRLCGSVLLELMTCYLLHAALARIHPRVIPTIRCGDGQERRCPTRP